MKRLVIVRPEPGASETARRARALGIEPVMMPLFGVRAVAAAAPASAQPYDALLLTSANAVRHGGAALAAVASLPVMAVGDATAEAARGAGMTVQRTGSTDVAGLLNELPAALRLLHLAGRDHRAVDASQPIDRIIVYESAALPFPAVSPGLQDAVAALHSPRAAVRFAELADHFALDRARIALVALSAAVATSAGTGWKQVLTASRATDDALLELAAELCLEADE